MWRNIHDQELFTSCILAFIISDEIKKDGIDGICSMNNRNTKIQTEAFGLKKS